MRLHHRFRSSRVREGWYDPSKTEIELEFQDGGRALYRFVPKSTWDGLVEAKSAGKYVNEVLNHFTYITAP